MAEIANSTRASSGAQIIHLSPLGCPKGVNPLEWRKAIKKRLDAILDEAQFLIDTLDEMTPDPDLEPDSDGEPLLGWPGHGSVNNAMTLDDDRELEQSDWEPSLGAPENENSQRSWSAGGDSDLELQEDDEDSEGGI